ncbi:MAG TPA: transcription antitermination factor NusB [Bacteroidota bacterium]|nr:transcription antitermination factor NusB [Bacteroidota bacterium]
MSLKRRLIREKVLQALYAYELSHEPIETIIETIVGELKPHPEAFAFAKSLILKVIEQADALDKMISQRAEHWEFNRIAIIDRIVIRMGICELLYYDDIPPKVSINEAIEIVRAYSTDKSDKFVNGVLDSVLSDLKKEGKLKKAGRGLVNSSIHTDTPKRRTKE